MSGYINLILRDYYKTSEATISHSAESKKEYYEEILKKETNSAELQPQFKETVNHLINNYISELKKKYHSLPKEKTLKIRLQNDVYNIYYPKMPESDYYDIQADYIKALLEDYSSRTYSERERFIYNKEIDKIELAIKNGSLLRIEYKSINDNHPKEYQIKPFKIVMDSESRYNYLIGLSKHSGTSEPYTPHPFRIFRICRIDTDEFEKGNGNLTKEEKKDLMIRLKKKGAAFIHADDEEFIVKLTPKGLNDFNNLLHLRPSSVENKTTTDAQGNTYKHFNCTSYQIMNYFFKFGEDAIIISPQDTTSKFKEKYQNALNAIENLNTQKKGFK